jgi:hypothetical protein
MTKLTLDRLYMLFALLLLMIGWKICSGINDKILEAHAIETTVIGRVPSSVE